MTDHPAVPAWIPPEYCPVREIPGHGWCGVYRYAYTFGLVCGLDATGWAHRYCYEFFGDAVMALSTWSGEGDPPGPWIKHKPSDRLGPGAID